MKKKYLIYYTTGDFTGSSIEHKVIEAESQYIALEKILDELNEWLNDMKVGFSPYYSDVKVYRAPRCLASFKGKDKNGFL